MILPMVSTTVMSINNIRIDFTELSSEEEQRNETETEVETDDSEIFLTNNISANTYLNTKEVEYFSVFSHISKVCSEVEVEPPEAAFSAA